MSECNQGIASQLTTDTVLGKDCAGNVVYAGNALASCTDLGAVEDKAEQAVATANDAKTTADAAQNTANDALSKAEKALDENKRDIVNITAGADGAMVATRRDGTVINYQVDTDQVTVINDLDNNRIIFRNEDGTEFYLTKAVIERLIDTDQVQKVAVVGTNLVVTNEDSSTATMPIADLIPVLNNGLATDAELAAAVAAIPKIISASVDCSNADLILTYADGSRIVGDVSCLRGDVIDDVTIIRGVLRIILKGGRKFEVELPRSSSSGGSGGAGIKEVVNKNDGTISIVDNDGTEFTASVLDPVVKFSADVTTIENTAIPYTSVGNREYFLGSPDVWREVIFSGRKMVMPVFNVPNALAFKAKDNLLLAGDTLTKLMAKNIVAQKGTTGIIAKLTAVDIELNNQLLVDLTLLRAQTDSELMLANELNYDNHIGGDSNLIDVSQTPTFSSLKEFNLASAQAASLPTAPDDKQPFLRVVDKNEQSDPLHSILSARADATTLPDKMLEVAYIKQGVIHYFIVRVDTKIVILGGERNG